MAGKGVGTTIQSIIMIILVLAFSIIFISTVLFAGEKQRQINLEEVEILKAKNTLLLLNRSLGMTWYITTVQAVFGSDNMGNEYWYETNPSEAKTNLILPQDKMCNTEEGTANPKICLPQPQHVAEFIKSAMDLSVPTTLRANGVDITLSNINKNIANNFWPAYDGIVSIISEGITGKIAQTGVSIIGKNVNVINTQFRKMVYAGWMLVSVAMNMQAQPYGTSDTQSAYTSRIRSLLNSKTDEISTWLEPLNSYFIENAELIVPTENEKGILAPQTGLLLHYDISAKFAEGVPSGVSIPPATPGTPSSVHVLRPGSCTAPQYEDVISSAVGSEWTFGSITYSKADIEALVKSLIQQESEWDQNAACSAAGGCGLMQITQSTADGDCAAQGGWDGIRNSVPSNIECGIGVLKNKFASMTTVQTDKENLKKLALAAYNGGEGTIKDAIRIAGDKKWESITLDVLTQVVSQNKAKIILNYVPGVLRCYNFYNFGLQDYTWPTDATIVTTWYNSVHRGLDIAAGKGTNIYATTSGTVQEINTNCGEGPAYASCGRGGYGNYVIIHDDDGKYSIYGHMDIDGVLVTQGQRVSRCTVIGKMGTTGHSTGPHVHFEIMQTLWGARENPCAFFSCTEKKTACTGSSTAVTGLVTGSTPATPASANPEAGYYKYSEGENKFSKAPFEVNVKVSDYLTALDCSKYSDQRFSWQSENDLICYGSWINLCGDSSEAPRYIRGIEQGNIKTQGNNLVGLPKEYQCVSMCRSEGSQEGCQPMFCEKHADGIKPGEKYKQCCTNWEWNDGGSLADWRGVSTDADGNAIDRTCNGNTFCAGDSVTDSSLGEVCDFRNTADLGAGFAQWCDGPLLRDCKKGTEWRGCSNDPTTKTALDAAYTKGVCATPCGAPQACNNKENNKCADSSTLCDSNCAVHSCSTTGCDAWEWVCNGDDRIKERQCRDGCKDDSVTGRCADRTEIDTASKENCANGCENGSCKPSPTPPPSPGPTPSCGSVCSTSTCSVGSQIGCPFKRDAGGECKCSCTDPTC